MAGCSSEVPTVPKKGPVDTSSMVSLLTGVVTKLQAVHADTSPDSTSGAVLDAFKAQATFIGRLEGHEVNNARMKEPAHTKALAAPLNSFVSLMTRDVTAENAQHEPQLPWFFTFPTTFACVRQSQANGGSA